MARIAIVKVRSAHDVEWTLPSNAARLLGLLGQSRLRDHLLSTSGQAFMPQLTLPYLAALGEAYNSLQGTRHTFELLDDRAERIQIDGYDMVWFTSVTTTAPAIYHLADAARDRGSVVAIGGIHATILPDEAAQHADAVVIGEGESTVHAILADYDRDGRLAPRYQGGRDCDLEALPVPRWDANPLVDDYAPWVVPVQTSRGCRNACHFCSTTRFQGASRRHRPVQEIVDEIRALQDTGVLTPSKVIFFTDNNIVSDSDHRRGVRDTRYARQLFEALIPTGVMWVGQGEIAVGTDPDLVELMARSGCFQLLIGFESISEDNLDTIGKPSNDVDNYLQHVDRLHSHGVTLIGCLMFGMDHDTPEVFERTARFIDRAIDIPQLTIMTPLPGTAQYRQMVREERMLHDDWSQFDITHVVHQPGSMTPQELEEGYRWLARRTFTYPAMFRRALRAATRPLVYQHPKTTFRTRFSSVLAPNLVYRALSRVGRQDIGNTLWQRELSQASA